jgi:hypothetical protein
MGALFLDGRAWEQFVVECGKEQALKAGQEELAYEDLAKATSHSHYEVEESNISIQEASPFVKENKAREM